MTNVIFSTPQSAVRNNHEIAKEAIVKTRKLVVALLVAIAALSILGVAYAQEDDGESNCPAIMGGSIRGYVYGRAYDGGVPVQEGLEVIAVDDSGYVVGCGETLQYGVIPMMTIYQSGRQDPGVQFFIAGKFFFSDPTIGEWWGNMKELRLTLTTERPQGVPEITVSLPTATVTQTHIITIPVTISSTVVGRLFAGEVDFDKESLEFLGIEGGASLPRGANVTFIDNLISEGRAVFYGGSDERFLLNGQLVLLQFRALEAGVSQLHLDGFASDIVQSTTELVDGEVTITEEAADGQGTVLYLPAVQR